MICNSCRGIIPKYLSHCVRTVIKNPNSVNKHFIVRIPMRLYSSLKKRGDLQTQKQPQEMSFRQFDELLLKMVEIEPKRPPSYSDTFADYVNHSKTLQSLILLGVELFKIENRHPDSLKYLVTLDITRDVKPKVEFLLHNGVMRSEIGKVITKNPKILDPERSVLEMQDAIEYLDNMKFSKDQISSLIVSVPTILIMPIPALDGALGFYQRLATNGLKKIKFSNDELRTIIIRCPRLITSNLRDVYEQIRTLELSCEFTLNQIRRLILGTPEILLKDAKQVDLLYKFFIREMGYTNAELVDFSHAFASRVQTFIERHSYLKHLGKDQYKREEPGYISLKEIYTGNDETFCKNLNLGSPKDFKKFIKTL